MGDTGDTELPNKAPATGWLETERPRSQFRRLEADGGAGGVSGQNAFLVRCGHLPAVSELPGVTSHRDAHPMGSGPPLLTSFDRNSLQIQSPSGVRASAYEFWVDITLRPTASTKATEKTHW